MTRSECKFDGCSKPATGKGWCAKHYSRVIRHGDPEANPRGRRGAACEFDGCARPVLAKDLCAGHYQQRAKGHPLRELRPSWSTAARDSQGRKRCRGCLEWLPESAYMRKTVSEDGLMTRCRRCETNRKLRIAYGITLPQYEELLDAQGGGCAICGGVNRDGRLLAVDHDHSCCPGTVDGYQNRKTCGRCMRGLLCSRCNMHLGAVGDSIEHLESMITYLRASRVTEHAPEAKNALEEAALKGETEGTD